MKKFIIEQTGYVQVEATRRFVVEAPDDVDDGQVYDLVKAAEPAADDEDMAWCDELDRKWIGFDVDVSVMLTSSYLSSLVPEKVTVAEEFCKKSFRQVMDEHLANAKAEAKKRKQNRKRSGQYANTDPLIKFLRQRVSRLNYGTKVPGHGVRPELSTDKFLGRGGRTGRDASGGMMKAKNEGKGQ